MSHKHLCPFPPPVVPLLPSTTDTCTERTVVLQMLSAMFDCDTHLEVFYTDSSNAAVQPLTDSADNGACPCGRDDGPRSAAWSTSSTGRVVRWQRVGSRLESAGCARVHGSEIGVREGPYLVFPLLPFPHFRGLHTVPI